MECVCPHCGKKIGNGQVGFDLTDFIKKQLFLATGFPGIKAPEEERTLVQGGIEMVFNSLSPGDHLIYCEKEIWNWPLQSGNPVRVVLMGMPYDRLLHLFDHHRQTSAADNVNKAGEWLRSNKEVLISMCFPLILEKQGNGGILFNLIRTTFDQSPVVSRRVCPECRGELSFWAGRYEEICLGVLGGPRVSKTTTVTACADLFRQGYEGITWQGHRTDSEYVKFEEEFLKKYRAGKSIDATRDIKNNIPKVSFHVTVQDKRSNVLIKELTLTFVDLPGELNNEAGINDEFYARYAHYFDNLDCLWYCTDPGELLQLTDTAEHSSKVRELGYEGNKKALSTDEICTNMFSVAFIFNRNGRRVPVAYILGKTDSSLISDTEKNQFHLFHPSCGPNYASGNNPFEIQFFHREALAVRSFMAQKNPVLVNTFEQNFPNHGYFAVSAYGFAPSEEERRPQPFNVAVPFLWMLALHSCYPITKMIRRRKPFGRVMFETVSYYLKNAQKSEQDKDYYNFFLRGGYLE